MTKPSISWQISIGNIIQLAAFVVAIAITYAVIEQRGRSNLEKIAVISTKVLNDIEPRLRIVESSTVRQGAEFISLSRSMEEIKEQQKEINQLLRQLIAQGGDR